MPYQDVSDAFDLDFWDEITIYRREQIVSDKGRGSTKDTCFPDVSMVVTAASGNDLDRLEDYDVSKKYIWVVGPFRLQLATKDCPAADGKNYKNDIVKWAGTTFEVITCEDSSRFGQGFIEAICCSTQYLDAPPTPPPAA